MTLLLIYLLLALGVSFVCSVLEAVLLSVNPSYIAVLKEQEHPTADTLESLKRDVDRPLSSILSLNTIAHTIGAAGVGAQAQVVFGSAYVTVTSIVLTLLILILSEIIPKTIGATYWRNLAPASARLLQGMIVLLYPLVLLSQQITRWLSRGPKDPSFSREEFSAMAEQGAREGIIEDKESRIFRNLMRFESVRVKDIMTPRTVVITYPETATIRDLEDDLEELRFTRIPVYGDGEDDITGYVLKQDMLIQLARDNFDKTLKELKREMLIIPEMIHLRDLFERLLERQEHIAVAVDEYGGFSGVVSMEDVVETLLGMEIVDEVDAIDDMQQWARSNWRNRAKRLGLLPDEDEEDKTEFSPEDQLGNK
jgi:CBS domain containing-hemolysin-like protein